MTPVSLIFDIGKTNKKFLLFDATFEILREESVQLAEIVDEDGDPCEDISTLSRWVKDSFQSVAASMKDELVAVNVAAYGASFVCLDEAGKRLTPLYNYLKPYPPELLAEFYLTYGGEEVFSLRSASPPLGSLNSGLQLYRLKKERPQIFTQVHYSLHLPQYLTWLLHGKPCADLTSIGCHTGLWDFSNQKYHEWVEAEGVISKFPPLVPSDTTSGITLDGRTLQAGVGLHDSSSALIPYLTCFREPFVLISTGTWNITLNPFNEAPLTVDELHRDCLCYLDYRGNPVKASRLFAGNEHEEKTARLADYFNVKPDYYKSVEFNPEWVSGLQGARGRDVMELSQYTTYDEGYHRLMTDLVSRQAESTRLAIDPGSRVKRIFVDGGFSRNVVFMNLLARSFGDMEVFAASVPQATALGAAMVVQPDWSRSCEMPDLVKLRKFSHLR